MPEPMKHNHPPVYGVVQSCEYCQKCGNVFDNGPFKLDVDKVSKHMLCFENGKSYQK